MVSGVWCLVFGVWCLVFGVWCLEFGVGGWGSGIWGAKLGVESLVFGAGMRAWGVGSRVTLSNGNLSPSSNRDETLGFGVGGGPRRPSRVKELGFRA